MEPIFGLVLIAIGIFLAGVLAGYRASWLDAYEKGRQDAQPEFDVYAWKREWEAVIKRWELRP